VVEFLADIGCSGSRSRAGEGLPADRLLQEGEFMKKLLLLVPLAGAMLFSTFTTGCASPAYSPDERHQQIARNADYEGKQATDDSDHFLMLKPAGHMTIWNVR
jgi:hypothetical protein